MNGVMAVGSCHDDNEVGSMHDGREPLDSLSFGVAIVNLYVHSQFVPKGNDFSLDLANSTHESNPCSRSHRRPAFVSDPRRGAMTYGSAESHAIATTTFPSMLGRAATVKAARTFAPEDAPAKTPSRLASERAPENASSSEIGIISSTNSDR
jgi:hypothetical protein